MPFPRPDEVAASSGVKSGSPETGRKREVAAAAASWLGSAIGGFSQQVKGFAADVISESTGEIDDPEAELHAASARLAELESIRETSQAEYRDLIRQRDESREAAEVAELQNTRVSQEYRALLTEKEQEIAMLKAQLAERETGNGVNMVDEDGLDNFELETLSLDNPSSWAFGAQEDELGNFDEVLRQKTSLNELLARLRQCETERVRWKKVANQLQAQFTPGNDNGDHIDNRTDNRTDTGTCDAQQVEEQLRNELRTMVDQHQEELLALQEVHAEELARTRSQAIEEAATIDDSVDTGHDTSDIIEQLKFEVSAAHQDRALAEEALAKQQAEAVAAAKAATDLAQRVALLDEKCSRFENSGVADAENTIVTLNEHLKKAQSELVLLQESTSADRAALQAALDDSIASASAASAAAAAALKQQAAEHAAALVELQQTIVCFESKSTNTEAVSTDLGNNKGVDVAVSTECEASNAITTATEERALQAEAELAMTKKRVLKIKAELAAAQRDADTAAMIAAKNAEDAAVAFSEANAAKDRAQAEKDRAQAEKDRAQAAKDRAEADALEIKVRLEEAEASARSAHSQLSEATSTAASVEEAQRAELAEAHSEINRLKQHLADNATVLTRTSTMEAEAESHQVALAELQGLKTAATEHDAQMKRLEGQLTSETEMVGRLQQELAKIKLAHAEAERRAAEVCLLASEASTDAESRIKAGVADRSALQAKCVTLSEQLSLANAEVERLAKTEAKSSETALATAAQIFHLESQLADVCSASDKASESQIYETKVRDTRVAELEEAVSELKLLLAKREESIAEQADKAAAAEAKAAETAATLAMLTTQRSELALDGLKTPEENKILTEQPTSRGSGEAVDIAIHEAVVEERDRANLQLDKLREHLIAMEDQHTEESVAQEDEFKVLKEKSEHLASQLEETTLVTAVFKASSESQIASLEAAVTAAEGENSRLRRSLDEALADGKKQASSLANLEIVLQGFEDEKEGLLLAAQGKASERADVFATELEDARGVIVAMEQDLAEATKASVEHEVVKQEANLLSGLNKSLKADVERMQRELSRSQAKVLEVMSSSSERMIDKELIRNMVVSYCEKSGDQKLAVLKLLADALDFDDSDRYTAGIRQQRGFFTSLLSGPAQAPMVSPHKHRETGIAEDFMTFLMEESGVDNTAATATIEASIASQTQPSHFPANVPVPTLVPPEPRLNKGSTDSSSPKPLRLLPFRPPPDPNARQ